MGRSASLLLCLVTFVVAGCANPLKQGDEAYARRDWDQATQSYQEALRSGVEPAQRGQVQARLTESRTKAGEAHGARASQLEAIGNLDSACQEADLAYRYDPSDVSAARLGTLKSKLGAQLLAGGKAALELGDLLSAVDQLSRAQTVAPTAEGQALLAQAEAALAEARRRQFEDAVQKADLAMAAHDWSAATSQFATAHRAGHTDDSRLKEAFSKAMLAAEVAVTSRNEPVARRNFESALRQGIDADYVQSRMVYLLPFDYVVTIHEGVILPFKPETEMAWDGLGTKRIAEASKIVNTLSLLSGGTVSLQARAGEEILKSIQSEVEPPDTYLVMTIGGIPFGSRDLVQQDTYRPAWQSSFRLRGSPSDTDSMTIAVFDRDVEEDDPVGSFQVGAADLLSKPGLRELYFVTKDGQLKAGGIVAIRLTVERN